MTGNGAQPDEAPASRALFVATLRRAVRSGLLWGPICGVSVAAIASSYAKAFPTPMSRALLAANFGNNIGFEALYGKARDLDTVAGFTAWRTGGIVWVAAVWAILIATRSLRGEEDAGRWEMFLSGETDRRGAAVQALCGISVGFVSLLAATAMLTVAAGASSTIGFSVSSSIYFATALVSAAAVFIAVGALASQLAATRRGANLLAGAVFGVSFILRMIADAGLGLDWMRWLTPFGWVENLRPLTGSEPLAFVPIVLSIAACSGLAVRIAAERDLGSSVIAPRDTARARTGLLGGVFGLTIRLTRGVAFTWIAGLTTLGLLFGVIATASAKAFAGIKGMEQVMARLGGVRGGVGAFLGLEFVIVSAALGFSASGQTAATRAEEASGYIDHLFSRPVPRWRWFAARLLVGTCWIVVAGVSVALGAWAGAALKHSGLGFAELVQAGVNVIPGALFVLGVGAFVIGLRPRLALIVAYGVVAWSFLVEIIGSAVNASHWLLDTSLLAHIRPAPAADPDWVSAAWLVGLGLLFAVVGVAAFARRDISGD